MKILPHLVTRALMFMMICAPGLINAQEAYPNRAVRLIIPYPTGGAVDPFARLVATKLAESWRQPVVVDNRVGGNTIIGADALAKSPPDGYTLAMVATTHIMLPSMLPSIPFDPIKDFTPIATLASTNLVLVVHPSVPATDMQQLIALAKSRPGQLNYASTSTGSPSHLAGEMLNNFAGIGLRHIPYKGGGPAVTDLVGGHVNMYFSAVPIAAGHIKAGNLRALATTGRVREPGLPQVPTMQEAGLPGFEFSVWFGILAPAGTPAPIIEKLSVEFGKIMAMPDVREKVLSQGNLPFFSGPAEFEALMKNDMVKYAKLIKAANIKFDN